MQTHARTSMNYLSRRSVFCFLTSSSKSFKEMEAISSNEVDYDEIDYIEIPSFLESLASSASQLKELATATCQHYIKGLISYGYIHEVKLDDTSKQTSIKRHPIDELLNNNHRSTLESLSSLVDVLPFLDELSRHIERCFTTLEITFRRLNYHLSKSASSSAASKQQPPPASRSNNNEFRPPPDSRFDPIFVAMMDLLFALLSLDETIKSHTSIRESISLLKRACQATEQEIDSSGKLEKLLELVRGIESTISRSCFQQCLEHLQHLDLILNKRDPREKLQNDWRNIAEHMSDFIVSYAENLNQNPPPGFIPNNLKSLQEISVYLLQANMAPTLLMTSCERKVLGLSSLFILYSCIFKKLDKRPTKAFNQMLLKLERINIISLAGSNVFMILSDFLASYLPKAALESKALNHLRSQNVDQYLSFDLARYFNEVTIEVVSWMIKLGASRQSSPHESGDASSVPNQDEQVVLEEGLDLIEELNATIRSTISAHLLYKRAITRNNLVLLLRSVALLKSIHLALVQEQASILSKQLVREHWLRSKWRKLMSAARKRSITSRYSDRRLDSNTSLILFSLCSNLIDRLETDTSRSLLFMATSMLSSTTLSPQELNDLNVLLSQMRANFFDRLQRCSDCAYLYWNVPTFSAYYNHVFEQDPSNIGEINYFHRAVDDIRELFAFDHHNDGSTAIAWMAEKRDQFVEKLADELMDQFRSNTLDKICQEFEIELRLQTHRDLHLDGHNPFRRHLYNFKRIFADQTEFRIFGRGRVSLKQHVEQHLSEIYHNLTSIAPHDWFSYDCMINFARRKYGLHLISSQMPTQTLDCGVDLMEITRNLPLFVSRYSYDMSNQLFIEKCSNRLSTSSAASVVSNSGPMQTAQSMLSMSNNNTQFASNQSLNVVQIRHVSMSIQNHGFGLLNSAINCTYQLMKRLVNLISKQTSDDKLRAILAKQHQQLSTCLVGSGISYDKALRLARKFRITQQHQDPLVTMADAATSKESPAADLDQIRQTLTQLGNSLAFMRLLKSGALNCASKSVDYLPDLDDTSLLRVKKFVQSEFATRANSSSLQEAAENFDSCLEDFDEHFSPKTDYFSIVMRLFGDALNIESKPVDKSEEDAADNSSSSSSGQKGSRTNMGDRFRLFYLLVPSLTINFIDHIINAKERVVSRSSASRVGALICDDGFSMGVAFLLIVLRQTSEFAKLDWFKEVRSKLEADQAEVERKVGSAKHEESLKQTSTMTLRRLTRLKREYEGLNHNVRSALLLFRSSTIQAQQSIVLDPASNANK